MGILYGPGTYEWNGTTNPAFEAWYCKHRVNYKAAAVATVENTPAAPNAPQNAPCEATDSKTATLATSLMLAVALFRERPAVRWSSVTKEQRPGVNALVRAKLVDKSSDGWYERFDLDTRKERDAKKDAEIEALKAEIATLKAAQPAQVQDVNRVTDLTCQVADLKRALHDAHMTAKREETWKLEARAEVERLKARVEHLEAQLVTKEG